MSFGSLPYALRCHIWTLAVEPRRITNMRIHKSKEKFSKKDRDKGKDVLYETSSTPAPALMHVCHESRQVAPYQRAFTAGTNPRWTWVNFEQDTFAVTGLYGIHDLVSHQSEVQRLHVRTDDDWDWYESATNGGALNILHEFDKLREIQIVLQSGDVMWENVYTEWGLAGHKSRAKFIDEGSGIVLTGEQLQMVTDWRTIFSFDSDGNPPEPEQLSDEIQWAADGDSHLTLAQIHEI
jgi:hypothetical protein